MRLKYALLFVAFLVQSQLVNAQETEDFEWWNPSNSDFFVVEGQAWPTEVASRYDRLPKSAELKVRGSVWRLAQNSAGLMIRFKTNAKEIKVRYQLKNEDYGMSHMPATGVSGVDLYAKDSKGEYVWYRGKYSFKDTVQYHYKGLDLKEGEHYKNREFQLFLPLYNSVEWMEIGVVEGDDFIPLPIRKEKPIVVYGTSIAQGACASRTGMAWTNILTRALDKPIVNLGFSGNGKLEKEVIEYINTIDAQLYVLDCLPNLYLNGDRAAEDIYNRIVASVKEIRAAHQDTPILMVDHAGYSDGIVDAGRKESYEAVNALQDKAFKELKSNGVKNLYRLKYKAIDMGLEDFVDGTHPSDLGMVKYASAYENIIRKILK